MRNAADRIFSADRFLWEGYSLQPSVVASKAQHAEMLKFAASKNIKPINQVFKLEGPETIEKIFSSLDTNGVRYRAVIEMP